MPLLTHTLWGALFCLPAGHSAEALRCSTLVMGYLALLATYCLMREVGAGRRLRLFVATVLACNPIFLALAFTYMTDLPFTTLSVTALCLFARSLRTHSRSAAALGTFVMLLAILNRQLGLFVGVAFAAGLLRRDGWSRSTVVRAMLPLTLGIITLVSFESWLHGTGKMPQQYEVKSANLLAAFSEPGLMLRTITEGLFVALCYVGLFTLPMLLLKGRPQNRLATAIGGLTLVTMAAALWLRNRVMPLGFNVLSSAGVGPDTLRDVYLLKEPNQAPLPFGFWLGITALAVIGASQLVARLIDELQRYRSTPRATTTGVGAMLLIGILAYCTPFLTQGYLDRYLLVLVPIVGAIVLRSETHTQPSNHQTFRTIAATAALLPLVLLAIAGTHDWMARSRTRWQALDWLETELGVPPEQIDGGFEYNGARTFDTAYQPHPDRSWWWVHDDQYVVAMGPLAGYRTLRTFAVSSWLPKAADQIVVLQRID